MTQNEKSTANKRTGGGDAITTVFLLVDGIIELYLSTFIKPFLKFHEIFYTQLNVVLRKAMDDNKSKIPDWFTANFITYLRTIFVIPCLLFLSWGYYLLPALIVLAVDFGDFLDGVAARFWIDVKKERQEALDKKEDKSTPHSPAASDASFEMITKGCPHTIESWGLTHRAKTYGGFVDAVCDKAFVVPCWISLLHTVPQTSYLKLVQYIIFFWLILAEVSSASIRFRAYYTSTGVPAPKAEGFDFSTSAVKADHVGKAKQTFEMVGTALYIIPLTTYIGLVLLFLAVPLAYESVRRKVKKRVMYVQMGEETKSFDHKTIKYWMQAKGMGSKLIVGVSDPKMTDMILNACSTACVDDVIAEAPAKADLKFLEEFQVDYVLSLASQAQFVTDEVLDAKKCLVIGEDGICRPLKAKTEHKD